MKIFFSWDDLLERIRVKLSLKIIVCIVFLLIGIVETIAGGGRPHKGKKTQCNNIENSKDGYYDEARFNYPWGIAYNPHDHSIYVADCVSYIAYRYL